MQGKYRHYKGHNYEVIGVGLQTETDERFVVYKPLYEVGDDVKDIDVFCRPYDMFFEKVTVDGKEMDRFTKLED